MDRFGTGRELMKVITTKRLGFLGHVMNRQGFENLCITGKKELLLEEDKD